ncbi:sulfotransferase [Pararhodobacter zhoushanensis]|uniref:sulfotransferase n=1 Tax=Pararhodobacter zhoushanensis TaxID=2479545 RepID=UPI001FE5D9D0|nr:sulfotransferase [Pararhodobacter zhoushanensis]
MVSPILILGTGRCGSTYLQTSLSGVSDIWIWGEHDGILRGLFTWARNTRSSKALNTFSFPYVGEDPYETLQRDGTRAAWVCPFDKSDIEEIERNIIIELFSRRLPDGKKRWGFKEIRYGPNSGVPERMLTLFPAAKIIHVVRDPRTSISSSIRAWNREVFDAGTDTGALENQIAGLVASYVDRWVGTTQYFEALCATNADQARTVKIEQADDEFPAILDFLEAEPVRSSVEVASETNPARNDPEVSKLIDRYLEEAMAENSVLAELSRKLGYS